MTYMLLIIEPTGQRQQRTPEQGHEVYGRMQRFAADLQARGLLQGTESLAALDKAVRVSRPAGRLQVLDGPFAEAKEMVGGYFLLNCASLAEAAAIARDCPAAEWATVEVRALAPCSDDSKAAPREVAIT